MFRFLNETESKELFDEFKFMNVVYFLRPVYLKENERESEKTKLNRQRDKKIQTDRKREKQSGLSPVGHLALSISCLFY
jgi:hypothetical protein